MSVFSLLIIIKEDKGRNCQQVQQMDTDGKSHQEGNQHDPPVCIRSVSLLIPFGHCPENQGGEKGRHRIDLTLYGRKPEGVAETVGKGADSTAAEDCNGL